MNMYIFTVSGMADRKEKNCIDMVIYEGGILENTVTIYKGG